MQNISLLILAAGMGSRYGGLKQLDQLGPSGETVMDYSVFDAIRAGFDRVIFVIRRDFEEEFRRRIGCRYDNKIKIEYAFQDLNDLPGGRTAPETRTKPWGTGHAVYAARRLLDTPFAVINADDFYGRDCYRQLADFLRQPPSGRPVSGCIVSYPLANTLSENGSVSRGICTVSDTGKLLQVVENTKIYRNADGKILSEQPDGSVRELTGQEPTSMNAWGFSAGLVDTLETRFAKFLDLHREEPKSEFYLPGVVDELLRQDEADITALSSRDRWFGITYREDKPSVEQALRDLVSRGAYPKTLF